MNVADIKIPENRVRREFPDAKEVELCDSLWRLGQLQPIVLHDGSNELLCGERRLRAILRLQTDTKLREELQGAYGDPKESGIAAGEIKTVHHSELPPEASIEAEVEENTHRLDLTWQEKAMATKRLHELRQTQHGEGGRGKPKGWTMKDTAQELTGRAPTATDQKKVSDSLLLAEFLNDPLVANAPSEKEAMKVLRKLNAAQLRHAAAQNIRVEDLHHDIILGDCYKVLSEWSDGVFDCIVADPPYGRDMHKHTFDQGKHEYDDSRKAFDQFVKEFPRIAFRLMKKEAHIYVFCDFLLWNPLFVALEVAGFSVWRRPIIWDKGNVGTFGDAEYGPRHCYDCIMYANKGRRQTIAMHRDVINITQETKLEHAAGKPVNLYRELMARTVVAGNKVLDPMVGGGTFFTACDELKVHGTGIEEKKKFYDMALLRAAGKEVEEDDPDKAE